jgi:hypothetical protein
MYHPITLSEIWLIMQCLRNKMIPRIHIKPIEGANVLLKEQKNRVAAARKPLRQLG